ncbi:MAG: LuxR C-terminal-related transcriptional regulator, partial [Planctomycetota bacterium]
SVVDHAGTIRFVNARAAELFLQTTPEAMLDKSLDEVFDPSWAAERLATFDRIVQTERPVVMRHIRNGVQLQSTIRQITEHDGDLALFLIITIEGESTSADADAFDVVESELIDLGPLDPLSARELEVLALIGHGMTSKQIAKALHRSVRTVEKHCDAIREKLHSTNRVQVADFARKAGLRVEDATKKRL